MAERVSMDAGLRLEGVPALNVFGNVDVFSPTNKAGADQPYFADPCATQHHPFQPSSQGSSSQKRREALRR